MSAARSSRRLHPGIAGASFILAVLLTVSYTQQQERTKLSATRREELAALVLNRQRRAAAIEKELATLRERADSLRRHKPGRAAALQQQIEQLATFAGDTSLKGPGLIITLADSSFAGKQNTPDFSIQDIDVQLVVNELWLGGAEAIAVNGQRIVSTTAVRSAGKAILVNYKVLTSPYRIAAIGDVAKMQHLFNASSVAHRFHTWTQVYGLSLSIRTQSQLFIPAFAGSARFTHAKTIAS